MTILTRPVCTVCGSINIRADASAEWDDVAQRWALVTEFDNRDCEDCGGERGTKWVPVRNSDDPICECQNCDWRGLRSHLNRDIPDYSERVEPGEPEPAGECPHCKALAHEEEGNL